jgi:hypothetical protein
MPATGRRVPRVPLAFGITKWGPLPGTRNMWLLWGGPGDGLMMFAADPSTPGACGRPVEHPAGRGPFAAVKEAENAVNALVAAWEETSDEER